MSAALSSNGQAILLLTAPLLVGRMTRPSPILTLGEYARLGRALRGMQREPADLMGADARDIIQALPAEFDPARLAGLLGRGFLLSQALERWQARAIWVVSRADAGYPRRWKARLGDQSPPILYGCGEISRVEEGGLAVVGSRHASDEVFHYAERIGQAAARAGKRIISGGAKGVDQAAMRGCMDVGGSAVGVLADSLEKAVMIRESRNLLLEGRLLLLSPHDPGARFSVGQAMQRNKLIYALADAALVVHAELNRGGTWAGAVEQLDKWRFVPVYVRSTGDPPPGLAALREKGALPWPDAADGDPLESVFALGSGAAEESASLVRAVYDENGPAGAGSVEATEVVRDADPRPVPQTAGGQTEFDAFRARLEGFLIMPRTEAEIVTAIGLPRGRARTWLAQLAKDGLIEKHGRPIRYVRRTQGELAGMERRTAPASGTGPTGGSVSA